MAIQVFVFSVEAFAFQARSTAPKGAGWTMAEVVMDGALIHQTPNDAAFVTDEANRGDLLWIREISPESEWVQVKPPTGAISWILESDISEIRTGEGRVSAQQTRIRPGRHGARLPGPPGVDLPSGTTVWILSREPLVIPQRQGLMTWRAIEPPAVEPRFLRKESLRKIAERKEPEPDGFVAAKGPGMLAATDQPDAQEFSDQSPRSSESPKKPTKGPEEPMGKLAEDRSTRSGEQMADQPPSIDDLEILDIPQTLSGGSSAPIDNGVVDTPVRPSMPKIAPIADVGSDANSPPAGPVSPLELPSDPDAALETLESRFRVIMSEPLISWDFRPVLLACETLGRRELSAGQASRLNRLKTLAERQEEIGRSSREFWNSMRRSRSHDPANQIQATPVAARSASRFDISGLLLPSQRDVDGHVLYNLIGDSGLTIAYLKLPPAAPVEKWLGKKVGIRGRVRYHEDLRGRLVTVQDVEILEP
jgi:hypothetical protein